MPHVVMKHLPPARLLPPNLWMIADAFMLLNFYHLCTWHMTSLLPVCFLHLQLDMTLLMCDAL